MALLLTTNKSISTMDIVADTPATPESREESPRRRRNERENDTTTQEDNAKSVIEFAKKQAALQAAYNKRMEKYYQLPLRARMDTGKNLKNLRPLAVRNAEFC